MPQEHRRHGRHTATHTPTHTQTHTHTRTETAPAKQGRPRLRRSAASAALAALAVAALTASQATGVAGANEAREPWSADRADVPYQSGAPDDGSYHTELPPLATRESTLAPRALAARIRAESGIPATVLKAYKNAEDTLSRSSASCRLPWELLAAIGKVESGHARGGDLKADGTTREPILGPVLDGGEFALIRDTDGGRYDGDSTYDRAVGPMQFIPSTWKSWAADGNGDGKKDPHNIHDAALAAGRYLCANDRDLSRKADLRRAILSYNRSTDYLRTVLSWLDFYRKGTHAVPDGEGVLPGSPGAGSALDTGELKDHKGGGDKGGKEQGKGGGNGPGQSPGKENGKGEGGDAGGDRPGPGDPGPKPTDTASPGPDDPGDPGNPGGQDPTDPPGCQDDPTSPAPGPTGPETTPPSPSPSPTDSDSPCETGKG